MLESGSQARLKPTLFHLDRGNVGIAHLFVERRQVAVQQLLQLLQFGIGLRGEIFIHLLLLPRGRGVALLDGALERRQLVIQLDREVERIFAGLQLGLVERFFDFGSFLSRALAASLTLSSVS